MWELQTPEAMKALASRLAALVSPVDFIALYGESGCRQDHLRARAAAGAWRDRCGDEPDLRAGALATPRAGRTINHCDFYRLGPGDEEETGFREMCAGSIVVAEWPGSPSRPCCLQAGLRCASKAKGLARSVSLTGFGAWEKKLARFREIEAFLAKTGWGDARCTADQGRRVRAPVLPAGTRQANRHAHGLAAATRRPADPRWPPLLRNRASRARRQPLHRHFRMAARQSRDQRSGRFRERSAIRALISSRIWATPFSASSSRKARASRSALCARR